jgi:hypothetical protein
MIDGIPELNVEKAHIYAANGPAGRVVSDPSLVTALIVIRAALPDPESAKDYQGSAPRDGECKVPRNPQNLHHTWGSASSLRSPKSLAPRGMPQNAAVSITRRTSGC